MEIHAVHLRYRSLNEFMQIGGYPIKFKLKAAKEAFCGIPLWVR